MYDRAIKTGRPERATPNRFRLRRPYFTGTGAGDIGRNLGSAHRFGQGRFRFLLPVLLIFFQQVGDRDIDARGPIVPQQFGDGVIQSPR